MVAYDKANFCKVWIVNTLISICWHWTLNTPSVTIFYPLVCLMTDYITSFSHYHDWEGDLVDKKESSLWSIVSRTCLGIHNKHRQFPYSDATKLWCYSLFTMSRPWYFLLALMADRRSASDNCPRILIYYVMVARMKEDADNDPVNLVMSIHWQMMWTLWEMMPVKDGSYIPSGAICRVRTRNISNWVDII